MDPARGERLAAAVRRACGVAVLVAVPVLLLETSALVWGDPARYDALAAGWRTGTGRAVAFLLVLALAFHAADGLRAGAVELWPRARRGALAASLVVFAGAAAWAAVAVWGGPA